ncbi:MAG: PadR family transcriptional regulator [Planctomycetota bacterium]
MSKKRTNPDFVNGVPELVVLDLLAKRPMYGYELVQAIREASGGTLEFGEGCVYPLLHKLEERGQLASRRMEIGGRSRVVYRVTVGGRKRFAEAAARWREVVEGVQQVLGGSTSVPSRAG